MIRKASTESNTDFERWTSIKKSSVRWILAMNILLTIILVIVLSVPWYQWKLSFGETLSQQSSGSTYGNTKCFAKHTMSWFYETCSTTTSDCSASQLSQLYSCEGYPKNWHDSTTVQKTQVFMISFGLTLVALILNIIIFIGLVLMQIPRLNNDKYERYISRSALIPLPIMLIAFIYFITSISGAFMKDNVTLFENVGKNNTQFIYIQYGLNKQGYMYCLLPTGTNYNATSASYALQNTNPCNSFMARAVDIAFGGSGVWAILAAIPICAVMFACLIPNCAQKCCDPGHRRGSEPTELKIPL